MSLRAGCKPRLKILTKNIGSKHLIKSLNYLIFKSFS